MPRQPRHFFRLAPQYQPSVRLVGLDVDNVFDHPDIQVWRSIADRQNGTIDFETEAGRPTRWHIKRYTAVPSGPTPAEKEVAGIELLQAAAIPTVPLVGWGVLADGRSFVIVEDLAGYRPADKLLFANGVTFDRLLQPTADLSARLHSTGLHHRDLYLCHFFTRTDAESVDLRLIDCARVKRLPGFLTRYRWIVKDLSQFWYSTYKHPEITDADRDAWLVRYAERAGIDNVARLRRWIERKVAWIARHDVKLHRAQPHRNISIPT